MNTNSIGKRQANKAHSEASILPLLLLFGADPLALSRSRLSSCVDIQSAICLRSLAFCRRSLFRFPSHSLSFSLSFVHLSPLFAGEAPGAEAACPPFGRGGHSPKPESNGG